jgi:methyl-accepting chemotaxis protein
VPREETPVTNETTVVPVPDPAIEPAPVPSPTASDPRPGKGRRATGVVGQTLGIVGIVVSLALIVGVLYVRGWGTDTVTEVAANVDAAIARTEPMLETAAATVDEVAQRVGDVATAPEAVALDPSATPAVIQGLLDRLAALSARYTEFRSTYAGAREQIVSILDRLALIDRLVPGFEIPQGPVDALAGLDETARAIDTQVMQLIDAGLAVQGVNATAAAIADKAHQVEAGLDRIAAGIDEVGVRLDELRARVTSITSTVNTVITILCLALVLLLAYMALLHWILFRSSRGYTRVPPAA